MDTTLDEGPVAAPPVGSKAGRNERRKLMAGLLNNLCAAALVAALLQPALSLLRHERPFTIYDLGAVLVFGLSGLILHAIGQIVVSDLED